MTAGLQPVAADSHRAPAGHAGVAVVDEKQPAFVVRARAQPPGAVPGQRTPGQYGPHSQLAVRCDPDLTANVVTASFGTKVTGPLLLAKHFAGHLPPDGSFLFMSGATALKPAPGLLAVAATNAAVDAITAGLAVELAPIRVNAIVPGTIATGAYDALGDERKAALFQTRSAANPARRIGTADDIAAVALAILASGFLTGASIPVDGGEHLV
jgi:NAD(P)-dependent dehydrogenase (short-subunit alcohol dehydrogenase family)